MRKLNSKLSENFSIIVLKNRYLVIAGVVIISVLFSAFIPRLKINPDVFSNLPEDDNVAVLFNKVGNEFGGNYQCIIGIEADEVFSKSTLEHIRQVTDSLKTIEGISSVISLTNIIDIRGSEWGIEITRLVDEYNIPSGQAELDSLKRYTLSKPFYKGALISEDGKMTVVVAKIDAEANEVQISKDIKKKVQGMNLPEKIYFGGQPFMINAFADVIAKDILFLGPLAFIVIAIILILSLRSFYGFLLPLLNVMISALWTFGTMAILNIPLSIITSIIPILLVAVGSAYTIHFINRLNETRTSNWQDSIQKALSFIAIPVFYTAITDIFGFLSFAFGSYLDMINKFGLFTSLGIAFALILSMVFTPAFISVLPQKTRNIASYFTPVSILDPLLARLSRICLHSPKKIIIIWISVTLIISTGIFSIQRNVDLLSFLSKKNPNRITENILQEKMGGTAPVYILIKSHQVLRPEILKVADSIQQKMIDYKEIVHTQSLTDLFKQMNEVMGEGYRVPDNQQKTDNLWFLIDGQDILEQYINFDHTELLIHATYSSNEMERMKIFTKEMDDFFKTIESDDIQIEMTGWPSLMIRLDKSIVNSQISSLSLAFLLILICISLLLNSFKRGVIALSPIVLTLLVLFGIMGWLKIPLDFATVLVGSICIGIGIDYSIHISNHFRICRAENKTAENSLNEVVRVSGKAILINILAITSGFLILVFSSLVPLQRFGILLSVSMICSGLASITFLSSLLLMSDFNGKQKFNKL